MKNLKSRWYSLHCQVGSLKVRVIILTQIQLSLPGSEPVSSFSSFFEWAHTLHPQPHRQPCPLCCCHPDFSQSHTHAKLFPFYESCICRGFLLERSPQLVSWMAPSNPEDFSLNAIFSERPPRRILSNPLLAISLNPDTFASFSTRFTIWISYLIAGSFIFVYLSHWLWDWRRQSHNWLFNRCIWWLIQCMAHTHMEGKHVWGVLVM